MTTRMTDALHTPRSQFTVSFRDCLGARCGKDHHPECPHFASQSQDAQKLLKKIRAYDYSNDGKGGFIIDEEEAAAEIERFIETRLSAPAEKTVPMAMLKGIYFAFGAWMEIEEELRAYAARYGFKVED